jgi:hypothetical protein
MIPFHIDPRWYEERWYGDPPDEGEDDEPPRLRTGRLGRIAVCLALVAAIPALSYLGFVAAAQSPVSDAAPAYQD